MRVITRRGELTRRCLLDLFEWLGGQPWNVDSQRKMADLLRAEGEERPPSQGLISHALRFGEPKAYPPSEWFAERVAALHEHVRSSLEDRPALAELLGGRGLVVPPTIYRPQLVGGQEE